MGAVSASLRVPFPVDQVYAAATRVEDLPRWLPEVVEASLLDPQLAAGSRIRLRLSPAVGGVEVIGTVREVTPPSSMTLTGSGGPLSISVRVRLQPDGPSWTSIGLVIELTTPPLLGFIAREAERRINAELPASLERFQILLETTAR